MRLSGDLLAAGQAGYEEARQVFNGMIDRHRAAIALCASIDDVHSAVEFGRRLELPIAIRGGGHNVAGYDRLARLKAAYDPDNVFRLNQNICPGAAAKA